MARLSAEESAAAVKQVLDATRDQKRPDATSDEKLAAAAKAEPARQLMEVHNNETARPKG